MARKIRNYCLANKKRDTHMQKKKKKPKTKLKKPTFFSTIKLLNNIGGWRELKATFLYSDTHAKMSEEEGREEKEGKNGVLGSWKKYSL